MKMLVTCKCGKKFNKSVGHDEWSCYICRRKAILEKERSTNKMKPVVNDNWLS